MIILMHLVLKFWLWGRFVAEKETYVLNLMAGHLLNMTYNENGKWNVWELDHYTDRSSLGIHFWDLYWKMAYLKFERFWYSNVRPWETVQIWGDCPIWGLVRRCTFATLLMHWCRNCWCKDDTDGRPHSSSFRLDGCRESHAFLAFLLQFKF